MEALSIITVANDFFRICERLDRCIRATKTAREDIKKLHIETKTFANLLGIFQQTFNRPELFDASLTTSIQAQIVPSIVKDGKCSINLIQALLKLVRPLRRDKRSTFYQRNWARIQWLRRKEDVQNIIMSLNYIKCTANLLINLVNFNWLITKIGALISTQSKSTAIPSELVNELILLAKSNVLLEQCRSELEANCAEQEAASSIDEARHIGLSAIRTTRKLFQHHMGSHESLRQIITQPPESLQDFLRTNPDVFQHYADSRLAREPGLMNLVGSSDTTTNSTSRGYDLSTPSMTAGESNSSNTTTSSMARHKSYFTGEHGRKLRHIVPSSSTKIPQPEAKHTQVYALRNTDAVEIGAASLLDSSPAASEYDFSEQAVVCDRNDGKGSVIEYREPRKPSGYQVRAQVLRFPANRSSSDTRS